MSDGPRIPLDDDKIVAGRARKLDRREAMTLTAGGGLAWFGFAGAAQASTGVRHLISPEQLQTAYDFVIVGAGSAGCVLAHRLSRAGKRVLVIEAGGPAELAAIANPPDWPELQGSQADWRYATVPQPGLGGRIVPYPRGKVVGGSSTINALAFQRGHRAAYDCWPEGWRYADLLPYFKRSETFSGGGDAWHGSDGPQHVLSLADVGDRTPLASTFIEAAQELGYPVTPDLSGATATGAGWNQLSIRGHVRDDAATAYVQGLEGMPVDLLLDTIVLGLALEGNRCVGVRLADRIVRPDVEVLLCAGAIDSPRLLMLSGIGPGDHLRSLGIIVSRDKPDVGLHLEDHLLLAGVAYRARRAVPRSHYNHADSLLYVPQPDPSESPDLLVMCLSLPFVLPTVGPFGPPGYVLTPCLMRPHSRGRVSIAANDPRAPALIDPNYLSDPADLAMLIEGVTLARDLGATAAFAEWRQEEVYPGPDWAETAHRADFVRRAANSFHHPVGTCRIGSVVDSGLRIEGVSGLRIVDASVLPGLPAAMINAAVMAVAEKASDLVLAG